MSHGRSIDTNKILNRLCKYDYVSFDIFDTIVKRDVASPDEVFSLVEKEYNKTHAVPISGYKEIRCAAEKEAREKSVYSEITLDEIYERLPYDNDLRDELKNIEIDTEYRVCVPNKPIAEIIKKLQESNKKIFLVSDIYLPRTAIEKILNKCQINGYAGLWLSNEQRCRKRNGLFQRFVRGENLENANIIHVGDSIRADRLAVWKSGERRIHTLIIPHTVKNVSYSIHGESNDSLSADILNSFINNHTDTEKSCYHQIGYSIYGPILYGFIDWIIKNIKEDGIQKVFFLARDSYVIQKAFHLIYEGDCPDIYFCLSRKSIFSTRLQGDYSLKNVMDKVHRRVGATIESLLKHMDAYTAENILLSSSMGIDLNAKVPEQYSDCPIWKYLDIVNDKNSENYRTKAEMFKKYVAQCVNQEKRVAVVDVGWNGTAQKAFEIALNQLNLHIDVQGYYLGINRPENGREKNIEAKGFLVNENTEEEKRIRMKAYMGFLEFFLSAPHGMTKGYIEKDDTVSPVLEDYEYINSDGSPEKEVYILEDLENGALEFIKDLKNSGVKEYTEWNTADITSPLFSLCLDAGKNELKQFGEINFFDTGLVPMAKPQPLSHYLVHLGELKRDFAKSTWKPGFMKRLLGNIPFPYYSVYRFLINKYNK